MNVIDGESHMMATTSGIAGGIVMARFVKGSSRIINYAALLYNGGTYSRVFLSAMRA